MICMTCVVRLLEMPVMISYDCVHECSVRNFVFEWSLVYSVMLRLCVFAKSAQYLFTILQFMQL